MAATSGNPSRSGDEPAKLEQPRAENPAPPAQTRPDGAAGEETAPAPSGGPPPGTPEVGVRQRWRAVVATLLIVVACVLAPLSVVAIWTRNQVTTIDR